MTDGVHQQFTLSDGPSCSLLPLATSDENEASVYRIMHCICYALPHLPAIVWLWARRTEHKRERRMIRGIDLGRLRLMYSLAHIWGLEWAGMM